MKIAYLPYLYHGSPIQVEVLTPRPARGVGPSKDRLSAVYASSSPSFAIPFALPITNDQGRNLSWTMTLEDGVPRIVIHQGYLDLSRPGYLYRVPADGFEPVDELQWVSYSSVVPVACELINPRHFISWITKGEIR